MTVLPSSAWSETELYLVDCWPLQQTCRRELEWRWTAGLWHCRCWVDVSYKHTSNINAIVNFLNNTHTHTRLTASFPGLPGWAGTRKVKPIWVLLKQETVSGSGISWTICKSSPRSRQITTPAPTAQFFTVRMPFRSPNQQCQSTEGIHHHHHLFAQ